MERERKKEVEVELKTYTHFLRPVIFISYPSLEANNPLKADEYEGFLKTTFEQLTFAPDYTYEKGRNIISVRLRKPDENFVVKILKIIMFAFLFGVLKEILLPNQVIDTLQEYIVIPTYEKFLSVLSCIASPLIFFQLHGVYME